jgi:hypothetical protein
MRENCARIEAIAEANGWNRDWKRKCKKEQKGVDQSLGPCSLSVRQRKTAAEKTENERQKSLRFSWSRNRIF